MVRIDWRESTITIDEAVIPSDGGAVIKSPKTRTSIRQVAVDRTTLAQLQELRKEQKKLAADVGVALPVEAFGFSAEPGGLVPPYPDTISRAFTKLESRQTFQRTCVCTPCAISRPHHSTRSFLSAKSKLASAGRLSTWRVTTPMPSRARIRRPPSI